MAGCLAVNVHALVLNKLLTLHEHVLSYFVIVSKCSSLNT